MEEEKECKIYHKIEPNRKVRIFKNTFNDRDYYKIQITQKHYGKDETEKFYIAVNFKKGVSLDNETDIIIKEAYENFRSNPKDGYNPILYLTITDFEIVERQEQLEEQAYEKYQETLYENENEITDAQLPF